jgi:hypothetical protein
MRSGLRRLQAMEIKLEPGMVFATSNPQGLGRPIRWLEKWYAKDRAAEYGHAGIIQDATGKTLEALNRIAEKNLFTQYAGRKVLIVKMTNPLRRNVNIQIERLKDEHLGQIYPAWRLLLHFIPAIARRVSYKGKWVVCSELVAKFEWLVGERHNSFAGTNPDQLVDEWRRWKGFEIVFEGVLPELNK